MATNNSSDECKEEKDNSSDESEKEKDNSSDESEKDNSSDESEKDNSSDPKAAAIKKRKAVIKKPEAAIKKQDMPRNTRKKRKIVEKDDTEETLQLLLQQLNNGESKIPPPDTIVSKISNEVEFSRCIYKQLTESDVNGLQSRLVLGKKEVKDKFLCLLEESEIPGVEGIDVLVYGPDGECHEMKFKMWIGNTGNPVLIKGWSKFVKAYGLQKYSDVLRIWMFNSSQDRQICFAIHSTRFDITKKLSKRILKNVFKY